MDDEKIINLLNRDQSGKDVPTNEWASIHSKIRESRTNKIWKVAFLSCAIAFIALFIGQNDRSNQNIIVSDEEVYEFIMSDSYFDSAEDTYAWVEASPF